MKKSLLVIAMVLLLSSCSKVTKKEHRLLKRKQLDLFIELGKKFLSGLKIE